MGGTCKARPDRYTVACGRDVVLLEGKNAVIHGGGGATANIGCGAPIDR
jgi:hypothetical protein